MEHAQAKEGKGKEIERSASSTRATNFHHAQF